MLLKATYRAYFVFTVSAWTEVQIGVWLHDWKESTAGTYSGRPNFTRVGHGGEGSV